MKIIQCGYTFIILCCIKKFITIPNIRSACIGRRTSKVNNTPFFFKEIIPICFLCPKLSSIQTDFPPNNVCPIINSITCMKKGFIMSSCGITAIASTSTIPFCICIYH